MVTIKELKNQIRKHNKKQCIKLSQKKDGLIQSLKSHSAPVPAPAPIQASAPAPAQKKKKKKRMTWQTTPFGAGGPSAPVFGAGGGSSSSSKKKQKKKSSSGFLPSNSVGQQSFNKKMKKLKMKSKKSKGKDSAPDLAFGNAFSDGYV
jgi:hypothetical protein